MNSKQLVHRAIARTGPDRLPVCYSNRDMDRSDVYTTGYHPSADFVADKPGRTEWGFVWESLDGTMGQPSSCPLQDWNSISGFVPPNPNAPGRLDHVLQDIEENKSRFTRLGMGISGFNLASFVRGFEDLLSDLYTEQQQAERVLDLVFDFENAIIQQAAELPLDCVVFWDDWGTQKGLMISPEKWRSIFKPRYARQFELIHRSNKKVWFHSCGNVRDIIGDMIDIGVDVIELLQPDVIGIEYLAREFGGCVCFCCSVDHQRTAISGTKEEIFGYARNLHESLGCYNGGLIAYIEDYSCLGMTDRNYQWIREAFQRQGVRS